MQGSLSSSKIQQSHQVAQSRILNRKQIQKRLQVMKPQQMQKVVQNLTLQNNRLKKQVKELHEKVEELVIAKKLPQTHKNKNPQIQQQVRRAKKLLNQKYQEMNDLKAELDENKISINGLFSEEMKNQLREYQNKIYNVEVEIKSLLKQKKQIEEIYEINCQAMQEFVPSTEAKEVNQEKIREMKEQNKQLKKKIMEISTSSKNNEKDAQVVLEKFYHLKSEEQKFLKAIKNSKKKITVSEIKNIDVSQVSLLEQEIQKLKRQKKQTEKQLVNQKIHKDQRKQLLQLEAKQLVEKHKELLQKRMKAYNKLNLYQAKDRQHKQLKEEKEAQKNAEMEQRAIQTDKIVPKDFRKQYIGKSEGLTFDDSLILDYRSQIAIKSVLIYKTTEHIAFIKFYYETNLKRRYETKPPIEQGILRKYENKKYSAPPNSFLKSFKVAISNDIITKVWFQWSNGDSIIEGWEPEGSTIYTADIGAEERPISMFGSVSYQGKNSYALQCLGCEVNIIENDEF